VGSFTLHEALDAAGDPGGSGHGTGNDKVDETQKEGRI
jgi:hypothetical protein